MNKTEVVTVSSDEKKYEKRVVLVCDNGQWRALFEVSADGECISIPDLKRMERALRHGHRVYTRELTVALRMKRRKEEEALAREKARGKQRD